VEVQHVDIVGLEALQTAVEMLFQFRRVVVARLRDDEKVLARVDGRQVLADLALTVPVVVALRGVDVRDALLDRRRKQTWKPQVLPSVCAILDSFLFRCQPSLVIYLQITYPVWREEFPLP
jgi:hypothetical protein